MNLSKGPKQGPFLIRPYHDFYNWQMAREHESVFRAIFLYNGYDMPNLDELIKTIKESQKTLFILCGFPYAGKSFVAEELRKQTDITYVSIDAIFNTQGFNWDTNKLPNADEWQKIFSESYDVTRELLNQGKNVLFDSTSQTVDSRDKLREVARSVNADACVLYVQSSVETIWKRWEENQKNPTRSVVSRELIQMTISQFEAPTYSEKVITIIND